jgi:hypothetical protein
VKEKMRVRKILKKISNNINVAIYTVATIFIVLKMFGVEITGLGTLKSMALVLTLVITTGFIVEVLKKTDEFGEVVDAEGNYDMVHQKDWTEFRENGLLWWVNMILHTFGWAIVFNMEYGKVINVYPARVKYRGFAEQNNTEGYAKVSQYLKDNAENLLEESKN